MCSLFSSYAFQIPQSRRRLAPTTPLDVSTSPRSHPRWRCHTYRQTHLPLRARSYTEEFHRGIPVSSHLQSAVSAVELSYSFLPDWASRPEVPVLALLLPGSVSQAQLQR